MNHVRGIITAILGCFACAQMGAVGQTPVARSVVGAGETTLEFTIAPGRHYIVEQCEALGGQWNGEPSLVAASKTIQVSQSHLTPNLGFFRVRDLSHELAKARVRWDTSGIDAYVLWSKEATPSRFQNDRVRAVVESHAVVSAMIPSPADSASYYPETEDLPFIPTVAAWFDVIETCLADPSTRIELNWDETESYPAAFRCTQADGTVSHDMAISIIDTEHKLLALDLAAARARWAASGITSYAASMQQICYCTWPVNEKADVAFEVTNGTVGHAVFRESGNAVEAADLQTFTDTVEGVFGRIEALMVPGKWVTTTFDANGVPRQVRSNPYDKYIPFPLGPPLIETTHDAYYGIMFDIRQGL